LEISKSKSEYLKNIKLMEKLILLNCIAPDELKQIKKKK
jgi:hypothetical protein